MSTWRNILRKVLPGMLMLMCASMLAQEDRLIRAQQLYRSKSFDQAAIAIDSVIAHPETTGDFMSWSTRAFIYYELYKRTDKQKLYSNLRDTVITSAFKSENLKPDSSYKENNRRLLNTMSAAYFNLSKTQLEDSLNYEKSLYAHNKFKEISGYLNPGADFKQKDIEFYLAVGSVFSERFINDNNDVKSQETAKVALLKVLEVEPDHPNANINMGLMYYNHAVTLTKSLDYGATFEMIDVVQENIVKLAKQAEQFIYKVYYNDNKNAKAVEALYYIYYMLNEKGKSDDFKLKCKELGINVEPTNK